MLGNGKNTNLNKQFNLCIKKKIFSSTIFNPKQSENTAIFLHYVSIFHTLTKYSGRKFEIS